MRKYRVYRFPRVILVYRDHVEFEVDGNLGDDLMTPPDVLLERALNEADRLMREKEVRKESGW